MNIHSYRSYRSQLQQYHEAKHIACDTKMAKLLNVAHIKNSKIPFRTLERSTSVHEHHIYVLEKDNSCKQDTLTDISVYIYRLLYRYTVLLYKTCTDELYFCVHNSYKRDTHTHTHTDIALYIYRFM